MTHEEVLAMLAQGETKFTFRAKGSRYSGRSGIILDPTPNKNNMFRVAIEGCSHQFCYPCHISPFKAPKAAAEAAVARLGGGGEGEVG